MQHKRKWPKKKISPFLKSMNQMFSCLVAGAWGRCDVLRASLRKAILFFFKGRMMLWFLMWKCHSIWQHLHKYLQLKVVSSFVAVSLATVLLAYLCVFTAGVCFHLTSWLTSILLGLVSHSQNVKWTTACGVRAVTRGFIFISRALLTLALLSRTALLSFPSLYFLLFSRPTELNK